MKSVESISKSYKKARATLRLYELKLAKVNKAIGDPKFSAQKFIKLSNEYGELYGEIAGLIAEGIRAREEG